jgi:hypothetical protein
MGGYFTGLMSHGLFFSYQTIQHVILKLYVCRFQISLDIENWMFRSWEIVKKTYKNLQKKFSRKKCKKLTFFNIKTEQINRFTWNLHHKCKNMYLIKQIINQAEILTRFFFMIKILPFFWPKNEPNACWNFRKSSSQTYNVYAILLYNKSSATKIALYRYLYLYFHFWKTEFKKKNLKDYKNYK